MTFQTYVIRGLAAVASLIACSSVLAASDPPKNPPQAKAAMLTFGGVEYFHRWSRNGQNEFTPQGDTDLSRWHDMVTIDLHETVRNGEQLADLANRVMGKYQERGKILRTDSRPRTQQRPAEHLVVAVFAAPTFFEAAFARFVLVDGIGVVAVFSHRVYGTGAAEAIGEWLKTNGPALEKSLMSWEKIPSSATLKQLPQSK